jgi:hypothetical protein
MLVSMTCKPTGGPQNEYPTRNLKPTMAISERENAWARGCLRSGRAYNIRRHRIPPQGCGPMAAHAVNQAMRGER